MKHRKEQKWFSSFTFRRKCKVQVLETLPSIAKASKSISESFSFQILAYFLISLQVTRGFKAADFYLVVVDNFNNHNNGINNNSSNNIINIKNITNNNINRNIKINSRQIPFMVQSIVLVQEVRDIKSLGT